MLSDQIRISGGDIRPIDTGWFLVSINGDNRGTRYATRASKDALPVRVRQRRPRISHLRPRGPPRISVLIRKERAPHGPLFSPWCVPQYRPVEVKFSPH